MTLKKPAGTSDRFFAIIDFVITALKATRGSFWVALLEEIIPSSILITISTAATGAGNKYHI